MKEGITLDQLRDDVEKAATLEGLKTLMIQLIDKLDRDYATYDDVAGYVYAKM